MITLRPYQEKLINSLRESFKNGDNKVILRADTGAGKTIMFTYIVNQHLKRGGKALILTDRINLLKQANGVFSKFGLEPISITAGSTPDLNQNCHVAMVETLNRRASSYKKFLSTRTLIVIDEAHKTAFNKLFEYFNPDVFVIGATATPVRTGNQPSMDDFYKCIVDEVQTAELIRLGNLSRCKTYGIPINLKGIKKIGGEYDVNQVGKYYDDNKIYEGVIENYNRLTPNTKAIVFCGNIESATRLKQEMQNNNMKVSLIHSKMTNKENQNIISRYLSSSSDILINVGILTTGFDCPDIETVILYRATTSLPLFLQMVGRGSRITATKKIFTLLDFGNNIHNHDFWEAPREWSLEKQKKKLGVAKIKECPKCQAFLQPSAKECIYCGYIIPISEKEKKKNELVWLEELKEKPKSEVMTIAGAKSLTELVQMVKAKLISPFWVLHQMTSLQEARTFIKLMGYKQGFEYANKDRFRVFRQH